MDQAPAGTVDNVVARIERIPTSSWHLRARIIVGVATFFDAFDALAIATALPVLVPMWKLSQPQIGMMISAGFVGQLAAQDFQGGGLGQFFTELHAAGHLVGAQFGAAEVADFLLGHRLAGFQRSRPFGRLDDVADEASVAGEVAGAANQRTLGSQIVIERCAGRLEFGDGIGGE